MDTLIHDATAFVWIICRYRFCVRCTDKKALVVHTIKQYTLTVAHLQKGICHEVTRPLLARRHNERY